MNQQKASPYGTRPEQLCHRNASDTEIEAAESVNTVTGEARVHSLIRASSGGLTIKEAATLMGKTPNAISGRFTALREKGLIVDSGTRRGRSRVMVCAPEQQGLL